MTKEDAHRQEKYYEGAFSSNKKAAKSFTKYAFHTPTLRPLRPRTNLETPRKTKMVATAKIINIGTLNARGIKTDELKKTIAEDALKYDLDLLSISETHLNQEEDLLEDIEVKDNKGNHGTYVLFATDKTGILIRKDLQPSLKKIIDRICIATTQLKENKLHVIAVYAHTLQRSEENNQLRDTFYETLENVIEKIPKRDVVVIAGDFNAKTGSGSMEFSENIGRYGKGIMNSSGRILLETCRKYDLILTNTLFQHKMCHRMTWTAPFRNFMTKDGEPRKNPVRNQIDYIIVRNQHRRFITNSRSYNGINTNTDHKLVKMSMKIEWYKIRSRQTKTEKIDVGGLSELEKRREYKTKISNEIEKARQKSSVQEKWDTICEICKGVGKEVPGLRKRITEHKDDKLAELTSMAKVIRKDIESTISFFHFFIFYNIYTG